MFGFAVGSVRAGRWALALLACVSALTLVSWAVPAFAAATTRYLGASGSDAGACATAGSPCRSFSYAYSQSAPGDVVEVAAGSYGGQSIPRVTGRSGTPVEFRPAAGASVTLGGLSVAGGYVTVRDIKTGSLSFDAKDGGVTPVRDTTIINGVGSTIWAQTVNGLTLKGGSYGGNQNGPTVQFGGNPASQNILMDGVDFHDAVATNDTVHMECIWAGGVNGFTVRNSIFRNCAYFDIFFTVLNGPDPKNVLLENNIFEVPKQASGQDAPYAINIANWLSKVENFTIRNNSLGGEVAIQPSSIVNSKIVGNVGVLSSCKAGVAFAYNVWTSAKCAATDVQSSGAMSGFTNTAAHDWHLKNSSPAVDAASPTDFTATDREGKGRAGRADAGAHEFNGNVAPTPTPTPTATPTPTPTATPTPTPTPTATPTPTPDTQAPSVPQGMAWTTTAKTSIVVRWNASSDNVRVTGYRIYRNGTRIATPTATSYTVSGLTCGTRYTIGVTAIDAAGNESNRAQATGTTSTSPCRPAPALAPLPPSGTLPLALTTAPLSGAALFASLVDPQVTAAAARSAGLESVRLTRTRICSKRTRGCASSTTLRFTTSARARIAGSVERISGRQRLHRSRSFRYVARPGANRIRIDGRRLRPGRYRITLAATGDDGRRWPAQRVLLVVR